MNSFAVSSGQTRYMQVARILLREIRAGKLPVDAFLPAEHELSTRFSVSRHTIREALRRLQQLGVVAPFVGLGTKVIAKLPRDSYQYSASSIDELINLGRSTRHVVEPGAMVEADEALAHELSCALGQKFLIFDTLRWFLEAAEEEVAYAARVYVAESYAGVRDHLNRGNSIIEAVAAHFAIEIAEIEHRLDAAPAPAELADAFRVEVGSPCLKAVRRYSDSIGEIILISVSLAPAGRAAVTMHLRRST